MKIINTAIVAVSLMAITNPVLAGDIAAGEAIFKGKGCIACHGAGGKAPTQPLYPVLAGQQAAYLVKNIKDFKSGARKDPVMTGMAGMLTTEKEMQDVAAYLNAQK